MIVLIAAMSYSSPTLVEAVRSLGFETVETPPVYGISDNPEAAHADMQVLALGEGDIFLLKDHSFLAPQLEERLLAAGKRIVRTSEGAGDFSYPGCVKLNVAVVGRYAIGNFKYSDKKLTERLETLGYKLLNVRQGYAKCSCAVVSDNALITSDVSIARAASENGIDVLEVSPGNIALCESYGGFIGGACFLADKETLAFTGDLSLHPDHAAIEAFCRCHGVNTLSLADHPLLDIGGIVRIL